MTPNDIDTSDCWAELGTGNSFHRSLIRHFNEWLLSEIEARGFDARDPKLFNQDTINLAAWRLADEATARLKSEYRDEATGTLSAAGSTLSKITQGWLPEALENLLSHIKADFVKQDLYGLAFLIERASGAPPAPGDIPLREDFWRKEGPQE